MRELFVVHGRKSLWGNRLERLWGTSCLEPIGTIGGGDPRHLASTLSHFPFGIFYENRNRPPLLRAHKWVHCREGDSMKPLVSIDIESTAQTLRRTGSFLLGWCLSAIRQLGSSTWLIRASRFPVRRLRCMVHGRDGEWLQSILCVCV